MLWLVMITKSKWNLINQIRTREARFVSRTLRKKTLVEYISKIKTDWDSTKRHQLIIILDSLPTWRGRNTTETLQTRNNRTVWRAMTTEAMGDERFWFTTSIYLSLLAQVHDGLKYNGNAGTFTCVVVSFWPLVGHVCQCPLLADTTRPVDISHHNRGTSV